MTITGQQMFDFIITLINFSIMFMLFRIVVIIPMQDAVRLREQRVKLRLKEIEELAESAKSRRDEFKERFGNLDGALEEIRVVSGRSIEQVQAKLAEQTAQEEQFLLRKAKAEADALRREVEQEIRAEIAAVAVKKAEAALASRMGAKEHADVLSASIKKVGGLSVA